MRPSSFMTAPNGKGGLMETAKKKRISLQTRLPPDLHQWLSNLAVRNERTLNAEVIRILKQARETELV